MGLGRFCLRYVCLMNGILVEEQLGLGQFYLRRYLTEEVLTKKIVG